MASSSAFSGGDVALVDVHQLVVALVVQDLLIGQDDRDHDHLRIEKRIVEQIDRGVQQLIVARVPLRGLFADLERLADLRT
jgi:hypothetical protein